MMALLIMSTVCLVAAPRCLSTSRFGRRTTVLVLFGGRCVVGWRGSVGGGAVTVGRGRGVTDEEMVRKPW